MTVEEFARLEAVAKMPQLPTDVDTLGRLRQPVEAGRRRARENGLARSDRAAGGQAVGVEAEEQDADARPAVGRFVRSELGLEPASTLQPMTDVAKPVMDCAAVRAQPAIVP